MIETSINVAHSIESLTPYINNAQIIEKLLLSGCLIEHSETNLGVLKRYLDKMKNEEYSYEANVTNGVLEISVNSFGSHEIITVDQNFLQLPEVRSINRLQEKLYSMFAEPAKLELGGGKEICEIDGPTALMDKVLEFGRRGLTINRYKGLGEMNPDQLWETTLDPASRTLLQVKLTQAEEADKIFSVLMGDIVEPRRDFIQANAEKVKNLDV